MCRKRRAGRRGRGSSTNGYGQGAAVQGSEEGTRDEVGGRWRGPAAALHDSQ